MASYLSHLECAGCGQALPAGRLWNLCPTCGKPLLARYDLDAAARALPRSELPGRVANLWRYRELLPVQDLSAAPILGAGWTPLVHARRLGDLLGFRQLYIKDESLNPTGSFKARGLEVAVARARELGAAALAIPSAGNAAGAMSACAALAGLAAHVFMPADVPAAFRAECTALGAQVTLVDGLITDCARRVREGAQAHGWFDLSTLKEPYRIEGKKTMGYELAEQMGWRLPDVIIYPTGGGTGLVGMWKAFDEMERLGWTGSARPRMVTVQAAGCAPIVRAFHEGRQQAEAWQGAATVADGLRVPAAIGDFLILQALRASGGTAIAIEDGRMLEAVRLMGAHTGIFACPEGGATLAAAIALREQGWLGAEESVVLFNTGSGLKYAHLFA